MSMPTLPRLTCSTLVGVAGIAMLGIFVFAKPYSPLFGCSGFMLVALSRGMVAEKQVRPDDLSWWWLAVPLLLLVSWAAYAYIVSDPLLSESTKASINDAIKNRLLSCARLHSWPALVAAVQNRTESKFR